MPRPSLPSTSRRVTTIPECSMHSAAGAKLWLRPRYDELAHCCLQRRQSYLGSKEAVGVRQSDLLCWQCQMRRTSADIPQFQIE
jgi:hypothetical protein